jgi:alkylation response protein AidB-like acyl-CoA dehydrogenase
MEELFATNKTRYLLPKIKAFLVQEIYPLENAENITGQFSKVAIILDQKRELVKELGLWGLQHTEAEGGHGLTLCEFGQVSEVLATTPFGHYTFNCQAPDIGNMELINKYASQAIKDEYLHPLIEGKIRSCFSMTEPDYAGSNPVNMGTTAVRDGDEYVINGRKWFTSSADGAAFAVVMAVTNPEAAPHKKRVRLLFQPIPKALKLKEIFASWAIIMPTIGRATQK